MAQFPPFASRRLASAIRSGRNVLLLQRSVEFRYRALLTDVPEPREQIIQQAPSDGNVWRRSTGGTLLDLERMADTPPESRYRLGPHETTLRGPRQPRYLRPPVANGDRLMRVKDVKKVVLAYSGGLDTSVILRWLQTTYNCEGSSRSPRISGRRGTRLPGQGRNVRC